MGDLTVDCDTWDSLDGSGQRLMVLTAEPGTPSHDKLRILASYAPSPASPATTATPTRPPSTSRTVPWTKAASSEAR